MGLFDKLKDTVGNAIESGLIGPMDEEEKKYYDIILNLLLAVPRLKKEQMKKFIQAKYGGNCNEGTLDKALGKFEGSMEPKTNEIWYQITAMQSSRADYKDGGISWFKEEEVYDICYADFRDEVREKFKGIFKVVENNPSKRILEQGIGKIMNSLPSAFDYPHQRIAAKIICEELLEALFSGDELMQEIAADMVILQLERACKDTLRNYEYIPKLYSATLRAFHYQDSQDREENYTSITIEDCRDAVKNSAFYQEEFGEDPFEEEFEKENKLQQAAKCILESNLIFSSRNYTWKYWAIQQPEFMDAACFYAWEKIADEMGEGAETIEAASDLIYNYIENSIENGEA
ncbi:MAG: hypothetical protein IJY82_00715 [Oscillospiraceae bacterium]|nr:hypothetical protein [Oscillospiraceae bacterium]